MAGIPYVNTEDIARELDTVQRMNPQSLMTGWFSGVEYTVMKLLYAYPQLRPAYTAFSQARPGIWPAALTEESWHAMLDASSRLAQAVRELGDIDIELCSRPTESGECQHALVAGVCLVPWEGWHTES